MQPSVMAPARMALNRTGTRRSGSRMGMTSANIASPAAGQITDATAVMAMIPVAAWSCPAPRARRYSSPSPTPTGRVEAGIRPPTDGRSVRAIPVVAG